jgi:hypothetical protein
MPRELAFSLNDHQRAARDTNKLSLLCADLDFPNLCAIAEMKRKSDTCNFPVANRANVVRIYIYSDYLLIVAGV